MTQIQKFKNYFIAILTIVGLLPFKVFAGEIFLDSQFKEIKSGSQLEVSVFLNSQDQSINAIEGELFFPNDLLELLEIRDGNSIINFWIERPKIAQKVKFSGIIPGGYSGNKGLIFQAVFYAKKEGQGFLKIQEPRLLLNDGQGTEIQTHPFTLPITISEKAPLILLSEKPELKDINPPEDFKLEIASDPTVFQGKWFLVFSTQDKGSGIDHYEVKEERRYKILDFKFIKSKWEIAESPYLLKDQKLKSYIFVKAVDKAGNERIVQLTPSNPLFWYENWLIWVIIILGIVIAYKISRVIKSKIKYQKSK